MSTFPRSRPLALLTALLSAAVLSACGAAPGINGAGGAGPAGGGTIRTVDPFGGDPATEGEPKNGGVLVMGTDREAISFDPTVQNTNQAHMAVYDSLLRVEDGEPVPFLAQSMETTDEGTTWRLGLRPGVLFSDGTPLDAAAVIVNVQRHIDEVSSPGNRYATQIASMTAVDPLTVEFALKAPFGAFDSVFALNSNGGNLGSIMSPTAIAQYGEDIGNHPVGAGPFMLSNWVRDSKMELTRNPNYWQADKGLPRLDGLEFRPLPDTETRYASIENGDVDVIFAGYQTELLRAMQNPELRVYFGPGNGAEYVIFNFNRPPFDDRRMREALVRGIDLDAVAATQYRGEMARASGWFADDSPYSTPESVAAWPAYDPERAKQLVQEYVADGGSATVEYQSSNAPNRVQWTEFLQAQMAAIGITLQPQFSDLAQYSSSVVQAKDFQIAGWVGGPVDQPFPAIHNLFGTGGNTNFGSYSNPEVDALLNTAATTTDEAERTAAYQRVQLLTNQDIAVAYYSRGYLSTISKPEVKGMVRYMTRDTFFATVWLDR